MPLPDFAPDDLEVKISELLVATADAKDPLVSDALHGVLRLLREKMKMDVVFVAEFTNGRRVFRHVSQNAGSEVLKPGDSDPLEQTWCQRVVDQRLPRVVIDAEAYIRRGEAPRMRFPIGSYLAMPLVLGDGTVYGTLCCFSFAKSPYAKDFDLKQLRYAAQVASRQIDQARANEQRSASSQADWQETLAPLSLVPFV
jgi:GAF domain-containing protein